MRGASSDNYDKKWVYGDDRVASMRLYIYRLRSFDLFRLGSFLARIHCLHTHYLWQQEDKYRELVGEASVAEHKM